MAHYRSGGQMSTLGTVPTDAPKSFGEQLAAVLNEEGVSQRELARRLAEADGASWESKRRWIGKLLKNGVERPEPESVAAIEKALKKRPGFFVVSRRLTVARPDRLEELATKLADSLERQTKMDREIRRLRTRMGKLEARSEAGAGEATGPR